MCQNQRGGLRSQLANLAWRVQSRGQRRGRASVARRAVVPKPTPSAFRSDTRSSSDSAPRHSLRTRIGCVLKHLPMIVSTVRA